MKHSFAFLAGAFLITLAVVTSGWINGGLFLAGMFAGLLIAGAVLTIVGLDRVGRWLIAIDATRRVVDASTDNARSLPPLRSAATPGPRHKKPSHQKANVVTLPEKKMLRPIQQDVVSALVNQGMAMARAQQLVCEASEGRPGLDFDTLFRLCVAPATRAARA